MKGFLKSVGLGFSLTHRLWFAILFVAFVLSAIARVILSTLPHQITPQGIQVPEVTQLSQALETGGKALFLYLVSFGSSLFCLGGIVNSAWAILRREAVSLRRFLAGAARWFFPIVGWSISFFLLSIGPGIALGLVLAAGVMRTEGSDPLALASAFQVGVAGVFLLFLIPLVYSPIVLVGREGGVWKSFGGGLRFFMSRPAGNIGVLSVAVGVGLLTRGVHLLFLGIPLLRFLEALPGAYLTVFFPCLLCAYYHTETVP